MTINILQPNKTLSLYGGGRFSELNDRIDNVVDEFTTKVNTAQTTANSALPKSMVSNATNVTAAGYALDARQANPNISSSLGNKISTLSNELNKYDKQIFSLPTEGDITGRFIIETKNGWCHITGYANCTKNCGESAFNLISGLPMCFTTVYSTFTHCGINWVRNAYARIVPDADSGDAMLEVRWFTANNQYYLDMTYCYWKQEMYN